jgi:O-antigen/teichoic acid export membrane protein
MRPGFGFPDTGVTSDDRRRILRGTVHSFLIQGFSIALVFLSNWWLVRSTDTASYGLYVHVFNWVSILSVLVIGGRDDLVLALLPKYSAAGDGTGLRRLVRAANAWVLGATLIVGAAFIGLISLVSLRSLTGHRDLFLIAIGAVYFSATLSLNQMILQALDHVRQSQVIERIARPLLLIGGTLLFRLSATSLDSHALVILGSAVSAGCALLIFGLLLRNLRPDSPPAGVTETSPGITAPTQDVPGESQGGKASWFFLVSLFSLLSTKVTMLLLPLFAGEGSVGIFNISYRFADLLIFPFFLMHSVLPQLFARHSPEEAAYTKSLFNESTRLMTLISLPLLLVNIFAGRFLLGLFGPAFMAGYPALVLISLAQFLFSLFGPANTILMTQGRERYSAIGMGVFVGVLLISSRLLLPVAGITGGAIAILFSSALYNGLLNVWVYRIYGICTPFLSFLLKHRQ